MPRFSDFYAKVVALKEKYPNVHLSTYSDSNLQALKEIAEYCDSTSCHHYSESEYVLLRSAAYHRNRPEGSPRSILTGVAIKLRHEAYGRAIQEIQNEIFPGLKQQLMGKVGISENEEKKALEIVTRTESQWKRHKHFARMPSSVLDEIGSRLVILDSYDEVIKKDRQFTLPEELKDALFDLYDEFQNIMDKTRNELVDAMLARLALIPARNRRFLAVPSERSIPAPQDECYDDNVVAATLAALVGAGLNKKYVEDFIRDTKTQSTLTLDIVNKFRACITANGDESQINLLTALLEAPFEEQTEFPTSVALPSNMQSRVIELRIGRNGRYASLDLFASYFSECRQAANLTTCIGLYDSAEMPSVDTLPPSLKHPVAFTYQAPYKTMVLRAAAKPAQAKTETRRVPIAISDCMEFVTKYAIGRHDEGQHHTRQGRAEHLANLLEKIGLKMQVATDTAKFRKHCHDTVVILFLHYLSINDVTSDLSKQLEICLLHLLDVSAISEEVVQRCHAAFALREEKQTELASYLTKGCQFALRLFVFDSTEIKEKDPVRVFLQQLINMHHPRISKLLYEKNGEASHILKQEMSVILSELKQKDGQETKFFMQEGIAKEDFDNVLINVARNADIELGGTVHSSGLN